MVHAYAQPLPSFGLFTALNLPLEGALRTPQQGMQGLSAQWRREVQIGCGLQNLGNSCYLNSVLQCLAHLPPLANVCLAKQHSRSCKRSSENRPCICCTFERQVLSVFNSGQHCNGYRGAVTPSAIYNSVHVLNKSLQRGRQEDSHELLRSLVDAMERNLLRQAGNYDPHKPPKHPRTLVNQLFGGILQSQVRCLVCRHVSATWDPCMDISLELGPTCSSVEDALRRFTAAEKLDGDNKYRCEGCKQLVPAQKQMMIYDDPNVLVIHLKRFDGIFGAKISKEIAFSETLDLEPYICPSRRYCSSNGASSSGGGLLNSHSSNSSSSYSSSNGHTNSSSLNNAVRSQCSSNGNSRGCSQQQQVGRSSPGHYMLHGVLVHHGYSANSGHYLAYVKDGVPPTGHWHCMNDSQVYRVNVPTVLKQQAYMLFYVRTSMKQQALLPRQTGQDAAAAAVSSPGRLKRNSSMDERQQQHQQQQQQHIMIGPQLPPHLLVKRQKLQDEPCEPVVQQQQQRQAGDGGLAGVPQPQQQPEQQQQQSGPVFGPQLPPWYSSRRQKSSEQVQAAAPPAPDKAASGAADVDAGSGRNGVAAAAADTAAAAVTGQQFFAWARSKQLLSSAGVEGADLQQQQQTQQPIAPNPSHSQPKQHMQVPQQLQPHCAATADPSAALIQQVICAGVAEGVQGITNELREWLTAQLKEGKQAGITYEQCKAVYANKFRHHDLLMGLAQRLLQTLIDRFASNS